MVLHTEERESEDYMHGVGLASSSNKPRLTPAAALHSSAEQERLGKCPEATRLAKAQIALWRPEDPAAWARFSRLFGAASLATLKTTGTADALFARACHGLPPPCSALGCVDAETQKAVWTDAHRFYCSRFGGAEGGERAARLAMLPLLRELMRRLQAAADGGASERLMLFSGHDTVVAPVLAALGGMRAPGLCRWPPYASHLAFEIWERAGGQAQPTTREPAHEVRVLFNGRAVTRYLRGCDQSATGDFCPLQALRQAVGTLEAEFRSNCGASAASM